MERQQSEPVVETIVAISTPPGRGGIGMVRLAGPEALAIVERLVRVTGPLEHGVVRRARVLDPNDASLAIDDALVTAFLAPHSYTGDTVVEIAAHGSPVVLAALLRAALDEGARLGAEVRLARPGEFTQRAFLSGKIDLTQAEAVRDLIAAQTLDQARVAAQQMGGAMAQRVTPAKGELLHLMALLEAGMDFASGELDDVEVMPPARIAREIEAVERPLAELAASFRRGQLLRNGAAMALIGPPNAGKSSLFNRLLERERAIVTPLPGTTRDTVEESLALAGIPLRLIDTAGLRAAGPRPGAEQAAEDDGSRSHQTGAGIAQGIEEGIEQGIEQGAGEHGIDLAEMQGMARSRQALADADLVLMVHDAATEWTETEREVLTTLREPGGARPHLVVYNKADLLAQGEAVPAGVIRTSALTGEGLAELREAILEQLGAAGALAESGALNTLRQQEAVRDALASLGDAAAANSAGLPHEMLLMDLHRALRALDSLTGATTPDDILERIFSTFCIGK